ncbi:MAG: hypothetical protein LBC42_04000 [Puniceicoccales bacterium]|nr:hypothetical protein [Puniceicoccales bacterium]
MFPAFRAWLAIRFHTEEGKNYLILCFLLSALPLHSPPSDHSEERGVELSAEIIFLDGALDAPGMSEGDLSGGELNFDIPSSDESHASNPDGAQPLTQSSSSHKFVWFREVAARFFSKMRMFLSYSVSITS